MPFSQIIPPSPLPSFTLLEILQLFFDGQLVFNLKENTHTHIHTHTSLSLQLHWPGVRSQDPTEAKVR